MILPLTMDDILKHSTLPWSYGGLSINKSLKYKDMMRHPDLPWNSFNVSRKVESFEDVLALPQYPWSWTELSSNKCVMFKDVLAHLHLPWVWSKLSSTLNVSLGTVLDNPQLPWDWNGLCINPHLFEVTNEMRVKYARKTLAANKIARNWKRAISDPNYNICRKRLLNEFAYLQ